MQKVITKSSLERSKNDESSPLPPLYRVGGVMTHDDLGVMYEKKY